MGGDVVGGSQPIPGLWVLGREGGPPSRSIASQPADSQTLGPLFAPSPPPLVPLHACSCPPPPRPPTLSFFMQDFNLIFSMQILTGKNLEIESTEVSFHSSEI